MADIAAAINRVDQTRVYNISDIRRERLFPWISASNHISHVSAVVDDLISDKLLKAKISGSGRGRDYRIKGANIIKYLKSQNDKRKQGDRSSS